MNHAFFRRILEELNKYKFSNHNKRKFTLLLQKGVYPYECDYHWEKINETSLPEKEDFYSHLNMEDITDADYVHAKIVCQDFETDLYHWKWNIIVSRLSENREI